MLLDKVFPEINGGQFMDHDELGLVQVNPNGLGAEDVFTFVGVHLF